MAETTAVADSSSVDVARGPLVTMTSDQRADWRRTGELPPKEEAPAPSDAAKEQKADAGEAAPPKPQERRRRPDAEERIKTLTDERKAAADERDRLKAELDALKAKPAESPKETETKPEAEVKQDQQFTRPKPTPEDKNPDGSQKFKTYEDFIEDLGDWRYEQKEAKAQREMQLKTQTETVRAKVEEAKKRYENFDEVAKPFVKDFIDNAAIPPVVKVLVSESDVWPDLVFTLAKDDKFVEMAKTNPGKALRLIALTESLIHDQLESKPEPVPVKPVTAAPKPPAEVGGRNSAPPDPVVSALEAKDFRRFKQEANRRDLARLRA